MVRYPISLADLEAKIVAESATWQQRAATMTAENVAAAALKHKDSIWSEIKPAYMRAQFNKCIYCERPLAGLVAGKVEQDVEHYRPKGKISAWPKANSGLSYGFPTGDPKPHGYFWLAFAIQNYAASCKPCNSTRKSDSFPIVGARGDATLTLKQLNTLEKPLIVFPFGNWGDDPAGLFRFEGILIHPKAKTGAKHQRARVTIDFFGLNDREELWEDRFRVIQSIFANVEVRETTTKADRRAAAERTIADAISIAGPQALCAREFLSLLETDPDTGFQAFLAAEEFLRKKRKEPPQP